MEVMEVRDVVVMHVGKPVLLFLEEKTF